MQTENNETEASLVLRTKQKTFYWNIKVMDAAKELKEKLVQYAADTKDHTVSDTFVQLLRPRS